MKKKKKSKSGKDYILVFTGRKYIIKKNNSFNQARFRGKIEHIGTFKECKEEKDTLIYGN